MTERDSFGDRVRRERDSAIRHAQEEAARKAQEDRVRKNLQLEEERQSKIWAEKLAKEGAAAILELERALDVERNINQFAREVRGSRPIRKFEVHKSSGLATLEYRINLGRLHHGTIHSGKEGMPSFGAGETSITSYTDYPNQDIQNHFYIDFQLPSRRPDEERQGIDLYVGFVLYYKYKGKIFSPDKYSDPRHIDKHASFNPDIQETAENLDLFINALFYVYEQSKDVLEDNPRSGPYSAF